VLAAVCLMAFALKLVPAQTEFGDQVTWLSISPASPQVGNSVTVNFRVTNTTTNVQFLWLTGELTWLRPDGAVLATRNYSVNLGPGQSADYSDSRTVDAAGTWTIKFRLIHPSHPNEHVTTLSVAPVYTSGFSETKAALTISLTHTPQNPKAAPYERGQPERADLITVTLTFTNNQTVKTIPALSIRETTTDPAGQTQHMASWSLPEIPPGQPQTQQYQFRARTAGPQTVTISAFNWGPPAVLGTFSIEAVPLEPPTTLTPFYIVPSEGTPQTQFVFTATYTSPSNTAPTSVKLVVGGQTYEMQKVNAGDNTYSDGCEYRYTLTLPLGTYNSYCYAYQGTQEVASASMLGQPLVRDPNPPVVIGGGQPRPEVVVRDTNKVTLSGSAYDAETSVAKVEWSTNKSTWQQAQGTTQWSFEFISSYGDQAYGSQTFYVRARDAVGNVTPQSGWWTQKVVWDRRHPQIEEVFVTEAGKPLQYDAVYASKPPDKGTPTKGNPYYIAFRIRNRHPSEAFTFNFKWSERRILWEPIEPGWPVNMDLPGDSQDVSVTLGPGETKWVWTWWQQDWNWIPEPDIGNFFANIVLMFISEMTGIVDAYQCANWADTLNHAIIKCQVETGPHPNMSPMLLPSASSQTITVDVSVPKKLALYGSLLSEVAAMTTTAAATIWSWTVIGGATGYIMEALLFAEGYALYNCAWDPDPDYKTKVEIQPIALPEAERISDEGDARAVAAALTMLENTRAAQKCYAKHLGAVKANVPEYAASQAEDAALFAGRAAEQARVLQDYIEKAVQTLERATERDRENLLKTFDGRYFPELEKDVLIRRLGFNQKQVDAWAKIHASAMPLLLENPELGRLANKRMVTTLDELAKVLEKAAGR